MSHLDNTSIPAKIEELAGALTGNDPEAAKKLDYWQKRFQALDGFAEYAEHPMTRYMIGQAMKIIKDARATLATDRKLTEVDRERLFEKIAAHLWYVDMFDQNRIQREMEGIGKSIDAELEDYEAPIPDVPYQAPNLESTSVDTSAGTSAPDIPVQVDYPVREGMPSSVLLGPETGDNQ